MNLQEKQQTRVPYCRTYTSTSQNDQRKQDNVITYLGRTSETNGLTAESSKVEVWKPPNTPETAYKRSKWSTIRQHAPPLSVHHAPPPRAAAKPARCHWRTPVDRDRSDLRRTPRASTTDHQLSKQRQTLDSRNLGSEPNTEAESNSTALSRRKKNKSSRKASSTQHPPSLAQKPDPKREKIAGQKTLELTFARHRKEQPSSSSGATSYRLTR